MCCNVALRGPTLFSGSKHHCRLPLFILLFFSGIPDYVQVFGRAMKFTPTANGQYSFTGRVAPVVFFSCFDVIEYILKTFFCCV